MSCVLTDKTSYAFSEINILNLIFTVTLKKKHQEVSPKLFSFTKYVFKNIYFAWFLFTCLSWFLFIFIFWDPLTCTYYILVISILPSIPASLHSPCPQHIHYWSKNHLANVSKETLWQPTGGVTVFLAEAWHLLKEKGFNVKGNPPSPTMFQCRIQVMPLLIWIHYLQGDLRKLCLC